MFLIAGLGNPTGKYDNTRHNAGFMMIDRIAELNHIDIAVKKFKGLCGSGYIAGQKVLLLKPQTYMNLSGESIREAAAFYHLDPATEVIVIYDDINLAPGQLRIRKKGSAGGHNGIKSIIQQLGTQDFPRVRVGVGEKPKEYDLADYVLGHFSTEDKVRMKRAAEYTADAVSLMIQGDTDKAMNLYNKKLDEEAETKTEVKSQA